jgi:hypothetical protein
MTQLFFFQSIKYEYKNDAGARGSLVVKALGYKPDPGPDEVKF